MNLFGSETNIILLLVAFFVVVLFGIGIVVLQINIKKLIKEIGEL